MRSHRSRSSTTLCALAVLVSTLPLQSCAAALFDDSCGPAYRIASASTDIRDASFAVMAGTVVEVVEERGDSVPGTIRLNVFRVRGTGPSLDGHIQSAALLDAKGVRVFELPLDPASPSAIAASVVTLHGQATVDTLRDGIVRGAFTLRLTSDIPGLDDIRTSLPAMDFTPGFQRAHCS